MDEQFSNLEVTGLPYMFSISTLFGKYYIYYFDMKIKKELDQNEYEGIRYKMQKIAKMSDAHDYEAYYPALQRLLDIWKEKFKDVA